MGLFIKHHAYDGFGRLVRTQSPYPDPQTAGDDRRTERFYYEGARRIQEIVVDPMESLGGAMVSGDPSVQQMAQLSASQQEANPDDSSTPLGLESMMMGPGGGGGADRHIAREYIWGPGDAGFDELIVQYDTLGAENWAIQDLGGDLMALCDVAGGGGGTARVVAQWSYDAYGDVLSAEHLHSHIQPHLGHKGLFLDRHDGGILEQGAEAHRLIPSAHANYHNRNRAYNPQLGRFLQRDPNATAMTLLQTAALHGRSFGAIVSAFDMDGLYDDGANLYEYLRSSPWNKRDPLGLASWDPFSMVDEYLAESAGSKAAFLSQLGMGGRGAAVVTASILSNFPFPFVSHAGDIGLYLMGETSGGELALAAAIGIAPGGKLLAQFGGFLARVSKSVFETTVSYARRGSAKFGGSRLSKAADDWLARKPAKYLKCGCFAAATLVWTPAGAVAIDDLDASTEIFAAAADGAPADLTEAEIGAKIVIGEASLLLLTVEHPDGALETIRTTDEHPFHRLIAAGASIGEWIRADALVPGDRLSTIEGSARVVAIGYTTERVPVHNLSIPGAPTYFVGERGVWVHNCDLIGKVYPSYREATEISHGSGWLHAHHIIPVEWVNKLDELAHLRGKTDQMPAMLLPDQFHVKEVHPQIIDPVFDRLGTDAPIGEIKRALLRIYQHSPDAASQVRRWLGD